MKQEMATARATLADLLEGDPITDGLYIRVYGDHLILGREEPVGPDGELEQDDRVRLTRLNASTFGLSVRRHTGRWERTPFSGTLEEMVASMKTFMQHLVAQY